MLNYLFRAWVKNVYRLCVTVRITGVRLSPVLFPQLTHPQLVVQNNLVFPVITHIFCAQLSTIIFSHFNPLMACLYPQSTAPIIRTKKER